MLDYTDGASPIDFWEFLGLTESASASISALLQAKRTSHCICRVAHFHISCINVQHRLYAYVTGADEKSIIK